MVCANIDHEAALYQARVYLMSFQIEKSGFPDDYPQLSGNLFVATRIAGEN